MRTATLTKPIQTAWGTFTPGVTVKLVAIGNGTAIIDFAIGTHTHDGRELHMYSVIQPSSITVHNQKDAA